MDLIIWSYYIFKINMADVVDGGAEGVVDSEEKVISPEKIEEGSEKGGVEAVADSFEEIIYPEKLNESSKIGSLIESVFLRIKNALNFIDAKKVKEAETKLDALIERIFKGQIYDIAAEIALINQKLYPEKPEVFSQELKEKVRSIIVDIIEGNHDGIYEKMEGVVRGETKLVQKIVKDDFCHLMQYFDSGITLNVDRAIAKIDKDIDVGLRNNSNFVASSRNFVLSWNLPIYIDKEKASVCEDSLESGQPYNDKEIIETCWDYKAGLYGLNQESSKIVQVGKYVYIVDIVATEDRRVMLKIKRGNLTNDGKVWAQMSV